MNAGTEIMVNVRELDGRRLHVVDGLFDAGVVRLIFETLARQSFSLSDHDTEATRDIRHWKCEFPLDYFEANRVLKMWHLRIVAKARELFAPANIELKRVHCNSHLYGDLQNAHTDISPGVTALYFANTSWQDDWQGETIFYNRAGEPFYALVPRPGRLVVFPGEVVHRGGVPSRKCFEARLSVAFKFEVI